MHRSVTLFTQSQSSSLFPVAPPPILYVAPVPPPDGPVPPLDGPVTPPDGPVLYEGPDPPPAALYEGPDPPPPALYDGPDPPPPALYEGPGACEPNCELGSLFKLTPEEPW